MRHLFLGWGSLLWDEGDYAIPYASKWVRTELKLPLEFSRISKSRGGALTLVIDPANGTSCNVYSAFSSRTKLNEAICDLRCREGIALDQVGFIDLLECNWRSDLHSSIVSHIRSFAEENRLNSVIWTELCSNFHAETHISFSIEAAVNYLKYVITEEGSHQAKEYIDNTASNIQTPLRKHLNRTDWWQSYGRPRD